jgi:hypothetical protein
MNPLLRILPRNAQRKLLLRHVRFEREKLEGLRIFMAESLPDLRGAMKLVHDVYASKGIIKQQRGGLHITKHNVLPSSMVFVAKEVASGRIVGTTTLLRDEPMLGLPMDATHRQELDGLRAGDQSFAEFVSTACDDEYRGTGLIFYLYRLAMHASISAGMRTMVMRVHPKAVPLYEELLVCERLGDVRNDPALNGKPAAGLRVDLVTGPGRMLERFGTKATERNPYHIFFGDPMARIDVPVDFVTSPERLAASAALVKSRPDLFSTLPRPERQYFRQVLPTVIWPVLSSTYMRTARATGPISESTS